MTAIFVILYIFFIFFVTLTSFFFVTRLQKYSINPRLTKPLILLFIITTSVLVIINILFFINIPFADIFDNVNYYY